MWICFEVGIYRAIVGGLGHWEELAKLISFVVGDGRRIRFWRDCWVREGLLGVRFQNLFSYSVDREAMIADYIVTENGLPLDNRIS